MKPFRFALQAAARAEDREQIVRTAQLAEALGYEELWSADHLGALDPFIPLVVAAEATTTLRVGPLVLNNELHHPVLLARTAASVDLLTGGRLVLGLGTGYAEDEHGAMGMPLAAPGRRVDRLVETVTALRSLLDTGAAHLDGTHHQLAVDDLGVRPAQPRVPILVGGHGRRVVTEVGPLCDLFQFTGIVHGEGGAPTTAGFGLAEVEVRARWLTEAAGARDADVERSILVQETRIGAGAGDARRAAAELMGVDEAVVHDTPFLLYGSVEQVVDELERVRERLGVSHVVVRDAEGFAPVVEALAGR